MTNFTKVVWENDYDSEDIPIELQLIMHDTDKYKNYRSYLFEATITGCSMSFALSERSLFSLGEFITKKLKKTNIKKSKYKDK